MRTDYENAIIRKFTDFGEANQSIRALVLTSSLCSPRAARDILSDFDIEMYFDDPMPWVERDDWIPEMGFGPLMAIWHWPNEWDPEQSDGRHWMRMVYFQDGTKMDIRLGCVDELRERSLEDPLPRFYDVGYEVLLDKDGITTGMLPPTFQAFIVQPPSEPQYQSRVETFWMESTYVSKFLWRGEIMAAKARLNDLARILREMLNWAIGMESGWTWKPDSGGRGTEKALDPETRAELLASFAGGDLADLWTSLLRTCTLYRKTAVKVGDHLAFPYPHALDARVTAFHETLMTLPKTATRKDLAERLSAADEHR